MQHGHLSSPTFLKCALSIVATVMMFNCYDWDIDGRLDGGDESDARRDTGGDGDGDADGGGDGDADGGGESDSDIPRDSSSDSNGPLTCSTEYGYATHYPEDAECHYGWRCNDGHLYVVACGEDTDGGYHCFCSIDEEYMLVDFYHARPCQIGNDEHEWVNTGCSWYLTYG